MSSSSCSAPASRAWSSARLPSLSACRTSHSAAADRSVHRSSLMTPPYPRPGQSSLPTEVRASFGQLFFLAVAFPPLRPASFFCAVVPPCFLSPPLPDCCPPCLDASGELAMRAARSLDMPLSLSASYCFSFLMLDDGTVRPPPRRAPGGASVLARRPPATRCPGAH